MLVWFDKCAIEKAETAATADAKIAAINVLIDTLFSAMLKAATTSNMEEYRLDDGQTKVSVKYKDLQALQAAHNGFLQMREYYLNTKNGRKMRLADGKAFPNWNGLIN